MADREAEVRCVCRFAGGSGVAGGHVRDSGCGQYGVGGKLVDGSGGCRRHDHSVETGAAAIFSVHGGLDGQDELRRALDFVDDRPVETANEANGIGRRSVEDGGVVERDERDIVARDPLRERGLAGLPGAGQQHDPGIRQGFPDPFFDMARVHAAVSDH